MKSFGIIAAMEEEVEFLRSSIENLSLQKEGNIEIYSGTIAGKEVCLMRSGIGKVNATMSATLMIKDFNPDCILNTGAAGGLLSEMEVGDIVISKRIFHHDFDLSAIGFKRGEVPGHDQYFGSDAKLIERIKVVVDQLGEHKSHFADVGSGEFFVNDSEYITEIKKHFPEAGAVEMEAVAIAQVCKNYEKPFVVIRAISDVADKEAPMSFQDFVKIAGKNSAEMVIKFIESVN